MSDLAIDEFEVDVTDDDVAFFHANGYLSIERITTDEEVDQLRGVFDELFAPSSSSYFDVMRPAAQPFLGGRDGRSSTRLGRLRAS